MSSPLEEASSTHVRCHWDGEDACNAAEVIVAEHSNKKWHEYFPRMTLATISVVVTYAVMIGHDLVMDNNITKTLNQFALVAGYLTSSWVIVLMYHLSRSAMDEAPRAPARHEKEGDGMSDGEFVLLLCIMVGVYAAHWIIILLYPEFVSR